MKGWIGILVLLFAAMIVHAETPATQPVASSASVFESLTAHLNDFQQWSIGAGTWRTTPEGHIRGEGESSLGFTHDLPANFLLEFRMNVVDGMRPRIFLEKSGIYIGNEGFVQIIAAYNVNNLRGLEWGYRNGQEMLIGMKVKGDLFELYVNGELMSRSRRAATDNERLRLSAGDGWSRGVTEFRQFKISPVD